MIAFNKKIYLILFFVFCCSGVCLADNTVNSELPQQTAPDNIQENTSISEDNNVATALEKEPEEKIVFNALIDDYLPEDFAKEGKWIWSSEIKFSGTASHTDGANKDLHQHGFRLKTPIILNKNSTIEQFVFLKPSQQVKGVMIKLYAQEKDKDITVYWEADEEVFVDTSEYMDAWYMGFIPKPGKWSKLVINMKEFDIKEFKFSGMCFMTYGGESYWDATKVNVDSKK